eukprot:Protomagalhaensia_sp_Gyna_25__3545@NODE_3188_length_690_cov_1401_127496_g2670_i0_p1_GENE_NODE_3188_length_690_cov_1401_127496_g2670_i0NODE_3188_length_690_cov_1401_127496_g2670_i0_p1_ORF_typecomplete_len144_score9_47C2/PF00168_30/5_2e05_NODE_3188_length_690_cov_1401_127496_g2670_i0190621
MDTCFEVTIERIAGIEQDKIFLRGIYVLIYLERPVNNKYYKARTRTVKSAVENVDLYETLTIQSYERQRVFYVEVWKQSLLRKDELIGRNAVVVDDYMHNSGAFSTAIPLYHGDDCPAGAVYLSVNVHGAPRMGGEYVPQAYA